jgi:outer membrane receptor protein involved in Fe transport
MRVFLGGIVLAMLPAQLVAQQPTTRDSVHQHGDSLGRPPVNLQEITVTAAQVRREEPSSAVSITPLELRRATAINPYELLRQAAGIEVHDQGQGPGFASDAAVRGFSSDHSTDLALWIDGVPINEPVNGHAEGYNDWYLMFPEAIRSVDVIKGPTSPLYGNFALAGVVNVRTIERTSGVTVTGSGGSYGRADATLLTGFDHDKDGGVFAIRGVREDGWRPNAGYKLGQAHARLVHALSASSTIDAGMELHATGWDSPGFLTLDQFNRRLFDTVSNSTDGGFKRRAQERVSLRVVGNSGMLWRTTAYATQGRWQLFLTTPPEGGGGEGSGSQTEEEDHRYGFGLTSAVSWSRDRYDVTIGAESRWDHSHYENYFATNRGRDSTQTNVVARQASAGVFVQSSADLTRHMRLSVGGRYDARDARATPSPTVPSRTRGVVSPKAGLLYHFPQALDFYANVSRGFRQTDGVIEDPTLPFITAWAYETGVKLDQGNVSASVALFRMDVSNEQTFNPITLESTSGGKSRRQGVELGLRAHLTPALTLGGNWTFNDARYRRLISEDGDTLSGEQVFNTAKYLGSVALELAPPNAIWQAQLSTNVVGPYTPFDEPGVRLDPYALLHLSGNLRIGTWILQVGARNLLNHSYPELRAGGFIVPGQPRSVYGGIRTVF